MVSYKCKVLLEQPLTKDVCYDFRAIRARVMCRAWQLVETEKLRFKDAIKRAWEETKTECLKISAAV